MACPSARNTAINASALFSFSLATSAAPSHVEAGCACGTGVGGVGWNGEAAYCDHGTCVAGDRPADAGAPTATTLPACAHAPSLLASPVDGGVAGWSLGRTLVACGYCATGSGSGGSQTSCSFGASDSFPSCDGGSCNDGPCVVECHDDEYAVEVRLPGVNDPTIIPPTLPTGCHGPLGEVPSSAAATFECCPCE